MSEDESTQRCRYTWPMDHDSNDDPDHQSCCWRETVDVEGMKRCIWHANPETIDKSVEALEAAREPLEVRGQNIHDELVDGANLKGIELQDALSFENVALRNANLKNADLSGARLGYVDLSGANLQGTDLSEASLRWADMLEARLNNANFSEADLDHADLSEASINKADLSGASLRWADISEASLINTDLSGTDLIGAELSKVNLMGITLTGATVSRGTDIDAPRKQIAQNLLNSSAVSKQELYDIIARSNRELQAVYSANGLLKRARAARIRERRARRKEAKSEGGLQGNSDWLLSRLSSVFTGYGVRLRPVVGWMLLLYLLSVVAYWHWGKMAWDRSLYYSVVTFTTAPPDTPPPGLPSVVAGIETFAGTAAIVFLGYVLGSRERI